MDGIKRKRLAPNRSNLIKFLTITWFMLTDKSSCVVAFGERESKLLLLASLLRPFHRFIVSVRNFTVSKPSLSERFINNILYRRVNHIIPNSISQTDYIFNNYPFTKNKITAIQNYTDIDHFAMLSYPENIIPKVGVFARYNEQKNYKRFVEAMDILKNKGYKFSVDWYGNQKFKEIVNPCYTEMKELVERCGLDSVVHLKDHLKDVNTMMPLYDVISLPSLSEGFSNSISEAICCGKPMLVSNVSDNPYMVKEGINGSLFNPLDVDDMVAAFERFFNLTIVERKAMSQNSRKIAESLFDANKFVEKYIKILEEQYS